MTIKQIRQVANFCRGYDERNEVRVVERVLSKTVVLYIVNIHYVIQPDGTWECFSKSDGRLLDRGTYELSR